MVNLLIAMALSAIFIIVPVAIMGGNGVNMLGKTAKALVAMALRVGILALLVYWIVRCENLALDILSILVLLLYTAYDVKTKAHLRSMSYTWPVMAGLFAGVAFTGGCLLLVNITSLAALHTRYILPLFVVLTAGTADILARSVAVYYAGLRNHNQYYYYMLGNGATHNEALSYLMRRALLQAATRGVSIAAGCSVVGAGSVLMWGMVMGGATVADAVAMLVLLALGTFCSSMVAIVVAVKVARRYLLDAYGRIKTTE